MDISGSTTITTPIVAGRSIGLGELQNVGISVYPNPTNGILTISVSNNEIEKVWISSNTGVVKEVVLDENSQLDLRKEPAGFYLISTLSKSGIISSARFIIK